MASTGAFIFLILLVSASADQSPYSSYQNHVGSGYSFSWSVLDDYSGNDFGHSENRQGADTSGQYYVHLPDGRLQTVKYNVDPYSGYQAQVVYEGEKQPYTPAAPAYHKPHVAPVYHKPRPTYIPKPAPSYHSALTFVPSPKQYAAPVSPKPSYAPLVAPAQPAYRPAYVAPRQPAYRPVVPTKPGYTIDQPLYRPVTPAPYRAAPSAPSLNSASNGNSLSVHKPSKSPLKDHDHDPYLKSEAELLGKDFSAPFFYEYKSKLSTKGKLKKIKALDHHDRKRF